jgi:signal transduction histidine kinase
VLLVDDDEVDREAVRRALHGRALPAVIEEAASIREAEDRLGGAEFDCVILDYLLPEGPCSTFLPGLLARSRAGFVILTGQGDEQVAVELMKAGVADYLSKDGLDPARLRRAVRYAVSLRRAEQAAGEARAERERHADQLRRFVEGAPSVVRARSLQELASSAAQLTRSLFDAGAVLVSLRHEDSEVRAIEGAESSSLAAWAAEQGERSAGPEPRAAGQRISSALTSREGRRSGTLAVERARPIHADEIPVLDQVSVLVSVCADNLLLYETAAKAVRARDDVLAAVSHDLRTPLNNLRLGASLLSDSAAPDTVKVVQHIERSVAHMTRLVDDLVDMVRIEGKTLDLAATREESVQGLLSSAGQLIQPQAEAQGLRLVVEPAPRGLSVRADRHRALQVLSNLLGNAVKFTPEGGQITLRAGPEGDFVRFEVADTGVGIPESEGERIFSRFWRSDPRKRRGLGLGLYIAKGLVVAHGGRLWFESESGAGSRFYFTLPRAAPGSGQSGS